MRNLDYFDNQILRLLVRKGCEMNSNQIADHLGISWYTAKKHLKKLRIIGYVKIHREKKIIYYYANY